MTEETARSPGAPVALAEQQFQALVHGVIDYAIFMVDRQGLVASWNSGAERIKGYRADEIVGRHFSSFYVPEDRDRGVPDRALATARETGRYEAEGWRVRKDGTRFWASVVIDAIRDEAGALIGFAKVTRDETERRATREQLFRYRKMEALGLLTGGVAHDFNNLLTAVLAGVALARRHAGANEQVTRHLDGIQAAALRGAGITAPLMAFARRQPLEARLVDLSVQIPATVELVRQSLKDRIELVAEVPAGLWPVEIDPGAFDMAVLNVALNARDAMADGGILRLSAANATLDHEVENLSGPFVAIRIADIGVGIPAEIRERIFEPFFTTKRFGEGAGLGLAQVYGFIRQSKGAVTVDSEPGSGTTVTFYLPAGATAARIAAGAADVGETRGRVLIVEDDPMVAELGSELIRELGFAVRVAHSGKEALAVLQGDPDFNLMFSDVVMPGGMSGLELARRVRLRQPELPILLTTGYSEALGESVAEFPVLPKPYELDRLSAVIAELLDRKETRPGSPR